MSPSLQKPQPLTSACRMLQYGGALYLYPNCHATLTGCFFYNCAATSLGYISSGAVRSSYASFDPYLYLYKSITANRVYPQCT